MERPASLASKCAVFKEALQGFEASLSIDVSSFGLVVADAIRNGCIQKFEYCTELCWKLIRRFLLEMQGVKSNSPKSAAKEYFLAGFLNDEAYTELVAMLDDRNSLSHIYVRAEFDRVFSTLPYRLELMKQIGERICGSL